MKEDTGFSATAQIKDMFIGTQGEDFEELKYNIAEAVNLVFEEKGIKYEISEIVLKHTLADEYHLAAIENEKLQKDFTRIDLEGWNDTTLY